MELNEVARLAGSVGFKGDSQVVMVAITKAENQTLDPNIINTNAPCGPGGLYATGLTQICPYKTRRPAMLKDPRVNMEEAYKLYLTPKGFGHWTTYSDGTYRKFLAEARAAVEGAKGLGGLLSTGGLAGPVDARGVEQKVDSWNVDAGGGVGGMVQSAVRGVIGQLIPEGTWKRAGLYAAGGGLVLGGVFLAMRDLAGDVIGAAASVASKATSLPAKAAKAVT